MEICIYFFVHGKHRLWTKYNSIVSLAAPKCCWEPPLCICVRLIINQRHTQLVAIIMRLLTSEITICYLYPALHPLISWLSILRMSHTHTCTTSCPVWREVEHYWKSNLLSITTVIWSTGQRKYISIHVPRKELAELYAMHLFFTNLSIFLHGLINTAPGTIRFAKLKLISVVCYIICDVSRNECLLLICPALHEISFRPNQCHSLHHSLLHECSARISHLF